MTSPLARRLQKLEAKGTADSLTRMSDAQLAAAIRDLWAGAAARGDIDAHVEAEMIQTARLFGVELRPGEAPMDLWERVRPALDEAVVARSARQH
jgi:hypothetical protein